jgi:tetratricopeptide (TPR) repeat protein
MMIKNEEKRITVSFDSVKEYTDTFIILDTGSTDNTIDIINKVLVGKKKGKLYTEPFINFRDSRNRCIDLAGKDCKFIVMLDDTYIIKGNLRIFLNDVRGDQFSDSFSLFIESDDVSYCSNRIIKSDKQLRYIYKIHEVINPKNNMNVIVPYIHSYIFDHRSDYMEKRTFDRKNYDLKILFEEVKENPDDPRALYYIAQTYNVIGKYDIALEYYLKRVNHPVTGFLQEKIDACFEAARMANFKLKLRINF